MTLTILMAIVVPATFLYCLHWLDLYGSDRPRIILLCLGWGLVAFALSFLVNRFCIDILGWPRSYVGTRSAPFIEELFKSGVLVYLVRRARFSYFVDGVIYGFASGIGFAIIENLRYVQLYPESPLSLVIVRDFSSALAHGTMTAITGAALGRFAVGADRRHRLEALLLGLFGAMSLHYAWNNFAFFSPFSRDTSQWVLVSVALAGVAAVGAMILFGLRHERRVLHDRLGSGLRVSGQEATLIQHMDDLERLLQPIDKRFGRVKRRQVGKVLHLEAQLGLKQEARERARDPALTQQLGIEVDELQQAIKIARREIGVYVMLYVRSIFPVTEWSLWTRLSYQIAHRSPGAWDVWRLTASRNPSGPAREGGNLYERLRRISLMRAQSQATAAHSALRPSVRASMLHLWHAAHRKKTDNGAAG
ncbi:MAG: PrsW family intramembrane metalloprotease [Pseudomonadota bacterium]|nr:PrsW family intramembrane metalloprotease [Pseudomonadota bacterium]